MERAFEQPNPKSDMEALKQGRFTATPEEIKKMGKKAKEKMAGATERLREKQGGEAEQSLRRAFEEKN